SDASSASWSRTKTSSTGTPVGQTEGRAIAENAGGRRRGKTRSEEKRRGSKERGCPAHGRGLTPRCVRTSPTRSGGADTWSTTGGEASSIRRTDIRLRLALTVTPGGDSRLSPG